MRHLKSGRALGVKPAHRLAMLRNMVTSLLEKQRITTTISRAKELRKPLDKMITLGKAGDLPSRRRALAYVKSKLAMSNLFGEFAERYAERQGGFSRIIRLGTRKGDGAEMAVVILVDGPKDPFAEEKKPQTKGGGRRRGGKVADEVAEEMKPKRGVSKEEPVPQAEAVASETPEESPEGEVPAESPAEAPEEVAKTQAVAEGTEESPKASSGKGKGKGQDAPDSDATPEGEKED